MSVQTNIVTRQELHTYILKGMLNGIQGRRRRAPPLQLEIIDVAVADRSGACQLAD